MEKEEITKLHEIQKLGLAVETALKGRNLGDIPLNDPYWGAVHRLDVATQNYKESVRVK